MCVCVCARACGEDTVAEGVPVSVSLGFGEEVIEDEFCNTILLHALHTHGEKE